MARKRKAAGESQYTVAELAANAEKLFNTRSECVIAALKSNGIEKTSPTQAKKLVTAFLKREVK